ncbi:MAG: NADH-quinone oxidoreductase subunit M [Gammaproteobacteria bacterium]|nr:NADH-quinone oxidoreductase subunit M [Gammaproteobacteria bacterium]MDH4316535.1 NADH-quinone oxidoreductase subunit M [Gammaproteobacteria bacterium]MDH5214906.1 NADH-quinone oxidoreductase subunit M [Gammaproteobacteria bacterium]MDH5501562.1 NADH-quinone oxidoreductase subunit M [Gammaproteobacteria bacterium]
MDLTHNILSILVWLPVFGGMALLMVGDGGNATSPRAASMRMLALGVSTLTFVLSIFLYSSFDTATASMQFVERAPWIDTFRIEYYLGVDGISAPLILLTTFITPLVVVAGWDTIKSRPSQYFAAFLILEGLMIGVFAALDAFLFYVFWEAMLVPMFLIIGVWGGERRIYATLKFFLYTFLGSVLMLVSFIYLYGKTGDFNFFSFADVPLTLLEQQLIFLSFLLAFAVKVPMWPVHTWLPDAHVEAPTGGSVILAAIMLKMGGYGFIRLSLPMLPDGSAYFSGLMIALSLIAVVYIGLVALMQTDMKKLIAYSSIAHMGFVTLGFFLLWSIAGDTGAELGMTGGIVQMISHGLVSGAMFLCVGVLYDRVHSRKIADYGGVANTMPVFAAFMVLFAMANAGLPGTSGFVGEFMVIIASFKANVWYAFFAATTLVLGAAYTLWMIKRVVYGEIGNKNVAELQDLNRREFFVLGVLALSVLLVGLWPAPLVDMMSFTVDQLLDQIAQSKLPGTR